MNGTCRFGDQCFNIHPGYIQQKADRVKSRAEDNDTINDDTVRKKERMKTSLDVIKRIQWDSDFNQVGSLH